MDSPTSPFGRFPFHVQVDLLPESLPDCHLVRTAIPYLLVLRQPRCFPPQVQPVLILFCKQSFRKISPLPQGHGAERFSSPFPTCPRKAGYAAHSVHGKPHSTAMQVYIRYRTEVAWNHSGSTPLHNIRSPQRQGLISHAIESGPAAAGDKRLPPAPTPDWA